MSDDPQTTPEMPADLDAIVAELDTTADVLPEKAIEAARRHKDEITPRLIELLERAAQAAQRDEEVKTHGHFFALFLLAEFRARAALPAVVQVLSLPGELPDDLFGDAISESVPRILAALAGAERLDTVLGLLDNPQADENVRWAAANAVVTMVAAGLLPRDQAVELLRQRLRRAIDEDDVAIITPLVLVLTDLYPEEAEAEIREAFTKELVEEFMIDEGSIDEVLREGRAATLDELRARPTFIEDTVAELEDWAWFNELDVPDRVGGIEEDGDGGDDGEPLDEPDDPEDFSEPWSPPPQPLRRETARVGRNDPCPCGSGKKFKRCCGARR